MNTKNSLSASKLSLNAELVSLIREKASNGDSAAFIAKEHGLTLPEVRVILK